MTARYLTEPQPRRRARTNSALDSANSTWRRERRRLRQQLRVRMPRIVWGIGLTKGHQD